MILRRLLGRARAFRYAARIISFQSTLNAYIWLFHRPITSHDIAGVLPKDTLAFVASPQAPLVEEEEDFTVLEDSFVAASENVFTLKRGDEATWTCIARGAQAYLAW